MGGLGKGVGGGGCWVNGEPEMGAGWPPSRRHGELVRVLGGGWLGATG